MYLTICPKQPCALAAAEMFWQLGLRNTVSVYLIVGYCEHDWESGTAVDWESLPKPVMRLFFSFFPFKELE